MFIREYGRQDGTRNRVLTNSIVDKFSNNTSSTRVLFINRQYFDQDRGADLLEKVFDTLPYFILTTHHTDKILIKDFDLVIGKYTVLGGSYCLLRYIQNILGCEFAQSSLR